MLIRRDNVFIIRKLKTFSMVMKFKATQALAFVIDLQARTGDLEARIITPFLFTTFFFILS